MVKIITNNVPHDLIYWHELTDKERAEFSYLDTEERQQEAMFFRYRGHTYDLGEFMRCPDEFKGWDGYAGDSFYSGVLVRYVEDNERVICALYLT